ncbi:MAG TPA: hypothetical protein VE196_10650 [Pseudonocardiaceae bacterium]|nr:hypothetical protein [Pseudonocardiaceae bacterium]
MTPNNPDPLISVRAAVVLLLTLMVGVSAGVVSYVAHHQIPDAVLVGGAAAGAALMLFHTALGR